MSREHRAGFYHNRGPYHNSHERTSRGMGPNPLLQIRPAQDASALKAAAALLDAGELVAVATETVYGLAADATNSQAVAKIFELKGRPAFNPLIIHCTDREQASRMANFDARATRLAASVWPGPLTLVLPRRDSCAVSELATAGLSTIALRVPSAGPVPNLIAELGRPLAAPSANRSGRLTATTAEDVAAEFGDRVRLILDAGPSLIGLESTVIALLPRAPARLLRPGGLDARAIEDIIGEPLQDPDGTIASPGMLSAHYAPDARLRLNARDPATGEAYLAFGPHGGSPGILALNLSPTGDLREAAANLFSYLRRLDDGAPCIAVAPIPESGLGIAINDRLRRAAWRD